MWLEPLGKAPECVDLEPGLKERGAGLDEEEDLRGLHNAGVCVDREVASLGEQRVEGAEERRQAASAVTCRKEEGAPGSFPLGRRNESREAVTATEACLSGGWATRGDWGSRKQ